MNQALSHQHTITGTLHIVGVGPGDPKLMTIKAVELIGRCPVIIAPKGTETGNSTALDIVGQAVDLRGKNICELLFPMRKIRAGEEPCQEVAFAWRKAAETVIHHLKRGYDVCFPTLGDPAIYSTSYYLVQTIAGLDHEVKIHFVPGIPAMSCCSASLAMPICLGDEKFAVIPATFSDSKITEILLSFDTVVLMKVHKVINELRNLLLECDLIKHAVLVEHAGTKKERIIDDIASISGPIHYYSTIIVRKERLKKEENMVFSSGTTRRLVFACTTD